MDFTGIIIEESLGLNGVLKDVEILETRVETVSDLHQTPWLLQWTLHTVKIPFHKADQTAMYLSRSFDPANPHWYADFKNNEIHYVIFPEKVFKVNKGNPAEYRPAVLHGLSLGIPEYQLDFTG